MLHFLKSSTRVQDSAYFGEIKIEIRDNVFFATTVGNAAQNLQFFAECRNFSFPCCNGLRYNVNFSAMEQRLTLRLYSIFLSQVYILILITFHLLTPFQNNCPNWFFTSVCDEISPSIACLARLQIDLLQSALRITIPASKCCCFIIRVDLA